MNNDSLKKQVISGFGWTFLAQGWTHIINFTFSIILARILLPEDFGLLGMIIVFISLGTAISNGGFSASLIRSPEVSEEEYSSVFYLNLFLALLLYLVLYFTAPQIALFYSQPVLTDLIRVAGLGMILNAFSLVPSAKLYRQLEFKTQFKLIVPSLFLSAGIGVYMALHDYGVWSLVVKDLAYFVFAGIQLWYYSKWVPKLQFRFSKIKSHFKFGYKLTIADIVNTFFDNLYKIAIGKYFMASQLGFYMRALSMQQIPAYFLINIFNHAGFPLLSSVAKDISKLKMMYSKMLTIQVLINTPVMIYLWIVSEPLFRWLLTEKWLPAVPYFQLLVVSGLFFPIHKFSLNLCKVMGRTDLVLKFSFLNNILLIIGLFSIIWYGIYGLLYSFVIVNIIVAFVTMYFSGKLIDYGMKHQLASVLLIFLLGGFSGAITYFIDYFYFKNLSDIIRLLTEGIIYILIFSILLYFSRKDIIEDVKNIFLNNSRFYKKR